MLDSAAERRGVPATPSEAAARGRVQAAGPAEPVPANPWDVPAPARN